MDLRYGTNPHQVPATVEIASGSTAPLRVVSGAPSYVNLLDAAGAWQLVREAARLLGRPAATSFKHVSPAGAAVAGPVDAAQAAAYRLDPAHVGALTSAYARARDADPKSSYGDFVAVSHPVDAELAAFLREVVSDGIIAPGFDPGVVAALATKKSGRFLILEADPDFVPPPTEIRETFGLRLTQPRDDEPFPPGLPDDVRLGLVIARYTPSNSVAYVRAGMALGIAAGQQSRIDCTALAGAKVDVWWSRRHPTVVTPDRPADATPHTHAAQPSVGTSGGAGDATPDMHATDQSVGTSGRAGEATPHTYAAQPSAGTSGGAGDATPYVRVQDRVTAQLTAAAAVDDPNWAARLSGVTFVSDGALPFSDNVGEAARHGVTCIVEPGGSTRSDAVADECARLGIELIRTGLRLFRH